MLNRLEQAQQKWGGSNKAIDAWLNERQDVLKQYCQLAGLPPYDESDRMLPGNNHIKQFCQILMDYISAGHFEVYEQIVSLCKENGNQSLALARGALPQISLTTDIALSFNDKFTEGNVDINMANIDKDLSILGQALEERFELEDQLIETLYLKHS